MKKKFVIAGTSTRGFLSYGRPLVPHKEQKKTVESPVKGTVWEIFAAAAFVGVIGIFHKMEGHYDGLCYTALFTPVSMLLVFVFANSRGMIMKILNNRCLLWLGNLSTYTFLIHQVVIRWLVTKLNQEILGDVYIFVLTVLSFVITVCGAELVKIIIKKSRRS